MMKMLRLFIVFMYLLCMIGGVVLLEAAWSSDDTADSVEEDYITFSVVGLDSIKERLADLERKVEFLEPVGEAINIDEMKMRQLPVVSAEPTPQPIPMNTGMIYVAEPAIMPLPHNYLDEGDPVIRSVELVGGKLEVVRWVPFPGCAVYHAGQPCDGKGTFKDIYVASGGMIVLERTIEARVTGRHWVPEKIEWPE